MVLGNLIFQTEVVEQRFTAVVLPHHDQQASDDRNQTEHGRMLSSNMLLRNLILLIDVTFSTPTPVNANYPRWRQRSADDGMPMPTQVQEQLTRSGCSRSAMTRIASILIISIKNERALSRKRQMRCPLIWRLVAH